MNNAERDLLTIKRDGLLKKKRLIDAIEKLRQGAATDQKYFKTNCFYLTESVGIHMFNPFKDLLDSIEKMEAASFKIESSVSGTPWGDNIVEVNISDKFDEVSKQIREEYHNLNKKLGRDKKRSDNNKIKNLVYYTNPLWLLWRLVVFIWQHKVISFVVLVIGLLATDYTMAWRNVKVLWNFVKSLF